ncbi:hypothetical protein KA005_79990 [bacterium]|nr:hypothetical protein [bacterium]
MSISKKVSLISPSVALVITTKTKQMKQEGIDVVGFGAGEPDFDTPEHIKRQLGNQWMRILPNAPLPRGQKN